MNSLTLIYDDDQHAIALKEPQHRGVLAQRDKLDLRGTVVDINLSETDKPFPHVDSITLAFNIPGEFSATDRQKLERASGLCPIKAASETRPRFPRRLIMPL